MRDRPNILMICSDQHTPRVVGAYGDPVVATPNLDALAADGCRFDAFYCNSPLCLPSRMSLMTGRYPFRCDAFANHDVLDSRIPTLAHVAVRGGYHAVLAGKMHFNGPDQRHGFLERPVGEPFCHALHGGGHAMTVEMAKLLSLGNCSKPDPLFQVGPGNNPYADYDRAITDGTIQWLDRYADSSATAPPFFLIAGYLLPHCPFIAPPELFRKYRGRVTAHRLSDAELANLHPFHRTYRDVIDIEKVPEANLDAAAVAYYALTDQLDQNVGRLIQALKANGLWENTIILYTSDHGEMLGQHGRWHKEAFYEDAARVPMIVRHPTRHLRPVLSEVRSLVDLMPTLCEWVGVQPPPGLDGTSFATAITNEADPNPDHVAKCETYTWWPTSHGGLTSNRMVRRGEWKLSYYGAFDSYELFNLADDPGEAHNLAGRPENAGIVAELSTLIFNDGWTAHVAAEFARRMEQVGYLQNIREYRDALRKNPLPLDLPDHWCDIAQARLWTEPE